MKKDIKRILALSWRDIKAPDAGGAEVHTHKMLSGLNQKKYKIVHFSPLYHGAAKKEIIDGVIYIRRGNLATVIIWGFVFYLRHWRKIDYVIDQCNTHRFFTWMYVPKRKRIFYIHQLTREIWDYRIPRPFTEIAKKMEIWMLRRNRKDRVITVSESTKQELVALGYNPSKITIVYNGISFEPWTVSQWYKKEEFPTFVYAGRYAPYKGIHTAIAAFAMLKRNYADTKLWLLGKRDDEYVQKILFPVCKEFNLKWENTPSGHADIISWGFVSEEEKLRLFSRAWALLYPSIREGWGIPVTEAGVVGTPGIVFDSAGLRDAVNAGEAGYICRNNTAEGLCEQMELVITQPEKYNEIQRNAYEYSCKFRWNRLNDYLGDFFMS